MSELTDNQKSEIGTRNACKIAHLLTKEERGQFVRNCNADDRDNPLTPGDPFFESDIINHCDVIDGAFTWSFTPEGHDYWRAIHDRIENN